MVDQSLVLFNCQRHMFNGLQFGMNMRREIAKKAGDARISWITVCENDLRIREEHGNQAKQSQIEKVFVYKVTGSFKAMLQKSVFIGSR